MRPGRALAAVGLDALARGILVPVMNLGILLICTAMLSGQSYNPFLYYRF